MTNEDVLKRSMELRWIFHNGDKPLLPSAFQEDWNKLALHVEKEILKARIKQHNISSAIVHFSPYDHMERCGKELSGLMDKLNALEEV